MMYKITLQNSFDGSRFGMTFYKGIGVTPDERLAKTLAKRGNEVEEVEDGYNIFMRTPPIPAVDDEDIDDDNDTDDEEIETGIELASLTKAQLVEYAADFGIDITGAKDKKAILAIIENFAPAEIEE